MDQQQMQAVVTAAAQALDQVQAARQQRVNVEAERGRREGIIRRATHSAPVYKAGDNFPQWKSGYVKWRAASGILDSYTVEGAQGAQVTHYWHEADFQANQVLLQFRGPASTRTDAIGPGTAVWNRTVMNGNQANHNARFDDYFAELENLFLPPAESLMARQQFLSRKQSPTEDVSSYLQEKFTLYRLAYSEAARQAQGDFLRDEVIKGCYNHVIRRRLLESQPADEAALRESAVNFVAQERQKLAMSCAESTNLDGLAASSKGSYNDVPEMMDVNTINAFRKAGPDDICNRCHKAGHFAYECRQSWEKIQGAEARGSANRLQLKPPKPANPDSKLKCRYCKNVGHKEADCCKKKFALRQAGQAGAGRGGAGGQRGRGAGGRRGGRPKPGVRSTSQQDGDDGGDYAGDDGGDYEDFLEQEEED